jgi:hypothetical protein
MSKKSSSSSNITSDNTTTTSTSSNAQSTAGSSGSLYDTNIQVNQNNNQQQQQQDFAESINRSLDQTKDHINRSIEESRNQIPQYNSIVNTYHEQTLQTAREIAENFIESQKTIINSIQSAWRPFSQNYNTTVNRWYSPESAANAYSRFVSTVADNTVTALRNTNNLIFSSLDSYRSTLQQARDATKQIFHLNSNAAKTFEQNARELTRAAQDALSQNNYTSYNNNSRGGGGDNTNTSFTTTSSSPAGTSSSSSSSTISTA